MGTGGKSKYVSQEIANNFVESLNIAIRVYDCELGDGTNIPKFVCIGNQKYEFKINNETWVMSLDRKSHE